MFSKRYSRPEAHYERMKSHTTDKQQIWVEQLEGVQESAEIQGKIFDTRFEGVQEAIETIGAPLNKLKRKLYEKQELHKARRRNWWL
jgi:hypothetical protein